MSRVREKWLLSFTLISTAYLWLSMATFLMHLGSGLLFAIIWIWVTYHYFYKKGRTRWLVLLLAPTVLVQLSIFLALGDLVIELLGALSKKGFAIITIDFFRSFVNFWNFIVYTGFFVAGIWFWINCLRLRKENFALKKASKSGA
ncbi:MAG: hypothetical protein K940chlam8_01315 [Chlamydiae bacterium]|nr:hypothetical protein [Chlamydiota bacterium]